MSYYSEHNEKRIIAYLSDKMTLAEQQQFEADIQKDTQLMAFYNEISTQRYLSLEEEYRHFIIYAEEDEIFEDEKEMYLYQNRMKTDKVLADKYEFEKALQQSLHKLHKKQEKQRITQKTQAILDKQYPHLNKPKQENTPQPHHTKYRYLLYVLPILILPLAYYIIFHKPFITNKPPHKTHRIDTHANNRTKKDSNKAAIANKTASETLQIQPKVNETPQKTLQMPPKANETPFEKVKKATVMDSIQQIALKYDTIISLKKGICWNIKEVATKYTSNKIGNAAENPQDDTKKCEQETKQIIEQKKEWDNLPMKRKKLLLKEKIIELERLEKNLSILSIQERNNYQDKKTKFEKKHK